MGFLTTIFKVKEVSNSADLRSECMYQFMFDPLRSIPFSDTLRLCPPCGRHVCPLHREKGRLGTWTRVAVSGASGHRAAVEWEFMLIYTLG